MEQVVAMTEEEKSPNELSGWAIDNYGVQGHPAEFGQLQPCVKPSPLQPFTSQI